MPISHDTIVFDVHDCKVSPLTADDGSTLTYGTAVDVPGIAEMSLDPNLITAELKGDGKVIAKKGSVDRMTGSATYGKLALDVLATVLGGTVTDAGVDPAETATWALLGDNDLPYFKLEFAVDDVDTGLGNVTVVLYKVQLTGGTILGQSVDSFGQPTMDWEAIPTATDDTMVDVTINQTAATIGV